MKTQILTFTLSIITCLSARAELKWEQTSVELHPTATDKQAVGHFKYQNPGKTPVHFKSVHASCGCTTEESQKVFYATARITNAPTAPAAPAAPVAPKGPVALTTPAGQTH